MKLNRQFDVGDAKAPPTMLIDFDGDQVRDRDGQRAFPDDASDRHGQRADSWLWFAVVRGWWVGREKRAPGASNRGRSQAPRGTEAARRSRSVIGSDTEELQIDQDKLTRTSQKVRSAGREVS